MKIPILVRRYIPQTKFDPDAVDAEIYCVNATEFIFSISTKSESFSTLDENTGISASHGSDSLIFILKPNESKLIAEVKGWEWDGHVGITLSFLKEGCDTNICRSYNFKSGNADYVIPGDEKKGRIIPPTS